MNKRLGFAALLLLGCPKEKPSPASDAQVMASTSVSASIVDAHVAPSLPKNANVVLISIDCLRADMPWTGYPREIAPNLTKLAKRAVVYTHAYSVSSYTSMSLGGFLGGKLPSEMKRDGYFFSAYAQDNLMFPEVIQSAGVHTVSAHAHGYFKDAGFSQGFDSYEVVPNLKWNQFTDENVTSQDLEPIAERLLSDPKHDAGRFFAWFHFLDPHDMYIAHDGIDWGQKPKTTRDMYDGEVTYTDRWVGKLLDFIAAKPWAARTVIVVTADHGEAFGEHGQYRHGFEVWEPLVRVPLMVVVPGIEARTIDVSRSALDMAPTMLDLFSLPVETSFEGTSLVPEILGGAPEERDVVVDLPKTSDNDRRRALIHQKSKIISFGAAEYMQAFDLGADADEKQPLIKGELYDDLTARLKTFNRAHKDKEIPATSCKEGCLWGTHKEVEGGAP